MMMCLNCLPSVLFAVEIILSVENLWIVKILCASFIHSFLSVTTMSA